MSAFNGRWKLQSSENMKAFFKALDLPEETMAQADAMEVTGEKSEEQVTTVTDTEAKNEMYMGGKLLITQKAALGVESEVDGLGGIKHKCMTTLDGNTLTAKSLDSRQFTAVHTVDGDQKTIVLTSGDVTCTRKYARM